MDNFKRFVIQSDAGSYYGQADTYPQALRVLAKSLEEGNRHSSIVDRKPLNVGGPQKMKIVYDSPCNSWR